MLNADEILSAVRRSEQARCQQIATWESLECGTAFFASEFRLLSDANQLRDAWLVGADAEKIYRDVEEYYADRQLICHAWTPALGQPDDAVAALLEPRGWQRREYAALVLTSDVPAHDSDAVVRILPARAMRKAYDQLLQLETGGEAQANAAAFRRLDDSHYEAFVAVENHTPLGRIAYLEVGDVARLAEFFVRTDVEDADRIRADLMTHFLQIARRLLPRLLVARARVDDDAMLKCLRLFGFEEAGRLPQYERPTGEGGGDQPGGHSLPTS